MAKTVELENGMFVSHSVAEITAVPHYELLDTSVQEANRVNQVLFTQIISSMHRKSSVEQTAFEFLFVSSEVTNQTYKAQVRMFVIARRIGADRITNEKAVMDSVMSIKNDMEDKHFSVSILEDASYDAFKETLKRVNCNQVLSVAKREKAVGNSLFANGMMYYNEVLQPAENINTSVITNTLTLYPGSAVSLQLIPTHYNQQELLSVEQGRNLLEYYSTQMRFRQGIKLDANMQRVVDAYNYYLNANSELLFLYNIVVFSDFSSSLDIANKLEFAVEVEGKDSGSALEITDISKFGFSLASDIYATPWIWSNILINEAREQSFWSQSAAPVHLLRLQHLMTTSELKAVYKFPIDDGHTTGLRSNKVHSNREQLDEAIISEGNFKIGRIENARRALNGDEVHAGVSLNDFTKHGLIVGMPGSGKTNFSLGLLLQFWNEFHIPFLAIEPTKSEYRSLIDGIPELQVFTPGKNTVSPYIINPFLPPRNVSVESYTPSLMSAFKAAFSMPDPLPDIFMSAINDCYNAYGWRSDSTSDDPAAQPFGLYEFIKVFKNKVQHMDYKGDVKSNMEAAGVVRLISLIEQNSNIYDSIHSIPLEDLLCKPTVIELNAINNKEQKSLIMALLLIMICVYTKNNIAGDGQLKNILLIDEAHVLLGGKEQSPEGKADATGSTIEALEDMIAEIRSYGTGIIIADQSPTKVGRNVIANTNVKIVFKLVEKENKDAIATATNMDLADYEKLGQLGVGEALLHYGRVNKPLHIRTYNVQEKASLRPVIIDSEITQLLHYWEAHQNLLIPHIECSYNCACKNECDLVLRSNSDFIATRLINLYFYNIVDKENFLRFLIQIDRPISELLVDMSNIDDSLRLRNCVKIKFLRKAMLKKNFGLSEKDYKIILRHPNFLRTKHQLPIA